MPRVTLSGRAKVWLYEGEAAWHFVTLPDGMAQVVRDIAAGAPRRGWGSVRVVATIGGSTWKTSVFPDRRSGSYLLPLKKEVREAEAVAAGDEVEFGLQIDA